MELRKRSNYTGGSPAHASAAEKDGNAEVVKGQEPDEDSSKTIWLERMVVACLFCGYFGREFCTLHLYTTSKLWQVCFSSSRRKGMCTFARWC